RKRSGFERIACSEKARVPSHRIIADGSRRAEPDALLQSATRCVDRRSRKRGRSHEETRALSQDSSDLSRRHASDLFMVSGQRPGRADSSGKRSTRSKRFMVFHHEADTCGQVNSRRGAEELRGRGEEAQRGRGAVLGRRMGERRRVNKTSDNYPNSSSPLLAHSSAPPPPGSSAPPPPGSSASARLSRSTIIIGLVSLLGDISSEMIYPILPTFLTQTLHAPATIVGLIEGFAVGTASVVSGFSGWISDTIRRRKPVAF